MAIAGIQARALPANLSNIEEVKHIQHVKLIPSFSPQRYHYRCRQCVTYTILEEVIETTRIISSNSSLGL